jgi:hypothetical protein
MGHTEAKSACKHPTLRERRHGRSEHGVVSPRYGDFQKRMPGGLRDLLRPWTPPPLDSSAPGLLRPWTPPPPPPLDSSTSSTPGLLQPGSLVLQRDITLQLARCYGDTQLSLTVCCCFHSTWHTLVESTLFPHHFNEITLNQRGIDVELTSVPSGLLVPLLLLLLLIILLLLLNTIQVTIQIKSDMQS